MFHVLAPKMTGNTNFSTHGPAGPVNRGPPNFRAKGNSNLFLKRSFQIRPSPAIVASRKTAVSVSAAAYILQALKIRQLSGTVLRRMGPQVEPLLLED